jgi:signal transduction histidine kinase
MRFVLAALAALAFCCEVCALDRDRLVTQYVREEWNAQTGLPGGHVRSIAQTKDGYLWIGTDDGLIAFDGFSFRVVPSSSGAFSNSTILGLTTDSDGNLIVRLQGKVLVRKPNGIFESVSAPNEPSTSYVTAMWREANGGILFADLLSGDLRFRDGKLERLVAAGGMSGPPIAISMAATPDGKVWMGTLAASLLCASQGKLTNVAEVPAGKINSLLPDGENTFLIGTDQGLFRWNGSKVVRAEGPRSLDHLQILVMLRDRDDNVWLGTSNGLFRMNSQGVSFSDEATLGAGGTVNALFEDREGNLWVGGTQGLERIRDSAFVTYSQATGLPWEHSGPLYADVENRIWSAPTDGGLFVMRNGSSVERVQGPGLVKDVVYSIGGQKNEIWLGRQQGGLTRLRFEGGKIASQTYTETNGLAQNSVYAVYESRDGTVWAGTLSGGVSRLKNGHFATYTTANGLLSNTINSIAETRDGLIWVATANGLSSWSAGSWKTYTARNGLPSDSVNCLFEDSTGTLWIGTAKGIGFVQSGTIQSPHQVPDFLREPIFGIQDDRTGGLWIVTANHVVRVDRDKLMHSLVSAADVREYASSDGLESTEGVNRQRSVVADASGRIWFSMARGLSVLDPTRFAGNSVPAIAHVEAISADGNAIGLGDSIHVPASRKRIVFGYTGLSLAAPERIVFRYFLDGFDRNWSEPTTAREAVFTNLGPGSYKFRVMASNSEGVWNGSETAIPFQVDPAFWQTWWFRLAGVVVIGLAVLAFFRLRESRLTEQMNIRFEERLAERTRIAQELHDTLLQGVISASMQLHVVADQVASDSSLKPSINRILTLLRRVTQEGRNAVGGLRSSKNFDLGQALSEIPREFSGQDQVGFRVIVAGSTRRLHPAIQDEIYNIGREALTNAFRHSRADVTEVELEYTTLQLRLLIRDNGVGIDPEVMRTGRDGHWGLSGMRERAKGIGGTLRVLSRPEAGTEIELIVPSHIAFVSKTAGGSGFLSKLLTRRQSGEGPDTTARPD